MARAELFLLQREAKRRAWKQRGELLLDAVGLVTDDEYDRRAIERERRPCGEPGERPAACPVEDLGPVALHSRSLPGGEDDGGDAVHPGSFPVQFPTARLCGQ